MRIFPQFELLTAQTAEAGGLARARLFNGKALGLLAQKGDARYFIELEGHDASFPETFHVKTDFAVLVFTGSLELRILPDSIVVEDGGHWRKPGYLVLSGSRCLLPVKDQVTGTCYYEFETGRIVPEPASTGYAITHSWSLHLQDPSTAQSVQVFAWPRQ